MATNRELIDQADAISKRLGIQVDTKGLSSSALADLVADLQRREAEQTTTGQTGLRTTTTDTQPLSRDPNKPNDQPNQSEDQKRATADAPQQRPPFSVALGKSVTSARGVLGPNQEIRAEDVGGQPNLDRLVERGYVVKA